MMSEPADDARGRDGGRLPKVALAMAALVAIGIATVWQHARAVRAGYRLHALEVERERLREERRRLEIRRAREERLDLLEERARKLDIEAPGRAGAPAAERGG